MVSKILIDLLDGEIPAIRVERPFDAGSEDGADVRDKLVKYMFHRLIDSGGNASTFFGTVKHDGSDSTWLVPMTYGAVLERLERYFMESSKSKIIEHEVSDIFTRLRQMLSYH